MKRPKKNKISNPTLPEDQQPDDRNLVDVEEAEEISFEDRLHLYWMENKGFISGCITVLALAIIGFNGMKIYVSHAESKIGSAYAEAVAGETLEAFAKEHSNKALGGLAALKVADTAYSSEEYELALEYYSIAKDALEDDLLLGRASIGLAFATFYSGEEEKGLAQLQALASDSGLPDAIRAEAAYHLAVEANVSGNDEAFQSYANQVTSSAGASQWQMRMNMYQQQR